jgi:hypothetical protein
MIFVVVEIIRHVVSFNVCHGLKTSFPLAGLEYHSVLILKSNLRIRANSDQVSAISKSHEETTHQAGFPILTAPVNL